jgi:hypothetical protein
MKYNVGDILCYTFYSQISQQEKSLYYLVIRAVSTPFKCYHLYPMDEIDQSRKLLALREDGPAISGMYKV